MLTLIIPSAGKSTRFNSSRPKYMLTSPDVAGDIMLVEAIKGIDFSNINRLVITVVKEHIEKSNLNLKKIAKRIFIIKGIEPEFYILDDFTASQSETVYNTIINKNITGPFVIKDCDNYFFVKFQEENSICVSKLQQGINAVNKSYVSLDKFGRISGIVEKTVIGDTFCVGGYCFSDAINFIKTFENLQQVKNIRQGELYISHCISQMLLSKEIFSATEVNNYVDWGDIGSWENYCKQFRTIFCDLDGVLVENSADFFTENFGTSLPLDENINIINELYDKNKTYIILTTARKEEYRKLTIKQLNNLNIKYHQLIMGLPHCQRLLINDYSTTNPYPSAIAISLKRNSDNLKDYITNF